jgi:hypothetical protein
MKITLNVVMKQDCDGLDLCIDEKVSRWMQNFDVKIFCNVIEHTALVVQE